MRRFRSRAELRAIFAKIREGLAGAQMELPLEETPPSDAEPEYQGPADGEMSVAAKRALKKFEESTRLNEFETGGLLDMKTGKVLFQKSGTSNQVSMTKEEFNAARFASQQTPTVFTHNHPGGNSFSLDDIRMAGMMGVREVRAVGETGWTHSMKPGTQALDKATGKTKFYWPAFEDLARTYQAAHKDTETRFWREISEGTRTPASASAEHFHEVWKKVSVMTGMKYTRTRWKKEPK